MLLVGNGEREGGTRDRGRIQHQRGRRRCALGDNGIQRPGRGFLHRVRAHGVSVKVQMFHVNRR